MNKIEKTKLLSLSKADAAADIKLINQYSMKELTPDGVFCFSVVLCDNEVDRAIERFPVKTLEKLAPLFIGKTGISDHVRKTENMVARIYRTEVETTGETNSLGEPRVVLRGDAYMLRNESNQPMIEAIEGGIIKEVSVSCAVEAIQCSICGKDLKLDWRTWTVQCEDGHVQGETYEGKLCFGDLVGARDAYEFSFVAVPCQRQAGVTKSSVDLHDAVEAIKNGDLETLTKDEIMLIVKCCQTAMTAKNDRYARAAVLAENEKYLKK